VELKEVVPPCLPSNWGSPAQRETAENENEDDWGKEGIIRSSIVFLPLTLTLFLRVGRLGREDLVLDGEFSLPLIHWKR
jgi:hypothetical protein